MNEEIDPQDQASKNALSLQQHAMQEIDAVAQGIADLQEKYRGVVYDVTTTAGMADAKAARKEIRQVRYDVERIRKDKGSELRRIGNAINTKAADITAPILELESPIDSQIKAEEERKESERAERQRQEQERIAAMQSRLDNLRNAPLHAVGATTEEIQQALDKMEADELDGFDEVFMPAAQQTREASLAALQKMLDERRALDEQAAELERQRQEQAEREAAEAQARREQQEKEDADRRVKQEAEDRARAEQAEQERAAREAEEAKLAKEREELEAARAEHRAAEERAAQERQEAAQKAEDERVAREQAEAEEREQARAAAEQAAIEAATIREAAEEVLALLDENGLSGHIAARKLTAALSREAQS